MNDGGNAFPQYGESAFGKPTTNELGMSLRDYFAAKAMGGWLAAYALDNRALAAVSHEKIADGAYKMADAMLKARIEDEAKEDK